MSNQEFSGVEQQLIRRAAATPITVPIFPMDELELVAVTRQACFHRERPPTRPRRTGAWNLSVTSW